MKAANFHFKYCFRNTPLSRASPLVWIENPEQKEKEVGRLIEFRFEDI